MQKEILMKTALINLWLALVAIGCSTSRHLSMQKNAQLRVDSVVLSKAEQKLASSMQSLTEAAVEEDVEVKTIRLTFDSSPSLEAVKQQRAAVKSAEIEYKVKRRRAKAQTKQEALSAATKQATVEVKTQRQEDRQERLVDKQKRSFRWEWLWLGLLIAAAMGWVVWRIGRRLLIF